ncbi:MAG: hypothetical protein AB7G75_05280 [Candidatus Binatia bacterium]
MNITFAALSEVANNDPEFRIAARFWNVNLRLEMGERSVLICIEHGHMTKVIANDPPFSLLSPANLVVSASTTEWQKFFAPIPKPFYVDLWGATTHHGFTVAGDMDSFYAYYPALRRLFDIMRGLAN